MKHPRSFRRLVATQFLTVFNDNLFKQSVLLLALAEQGLHGNGQAWAQALFSFPFLLFAVLAGDCADRYSKTRVVILCKWAEGLVMLAAAAAFATDNFTFVLVVVFLMGTQSAFLGPAKYGALPELATRKHLPRANGVFQASVLLGILVGTGSAGHLAGDHLWLLGIGMAACAAIGAWIAGGMYPLAPANPQKAIHFNPVYRFVRGLTDARQFPGLMPSLIGHSLFWFCGSLMLLAWNELRAVDTSGQALIDVSQGTWSLGLAGLSLFMAVGAVVAGFALQTKIPRWLPVLGAWGMAAGFACAGAIPPGPWALFATVAGASFFSGFYLIPLRSLMQSLAPPSQLGAVLGTSQMLDFLLIFLAALGRPLLLQFGLGPQQLFFFLAGVLVLSGCFLAFALPKVSALTRSPVEN